jgi:hypothetical protein
MCCLILTCVGKAQITHTPPGFTLTTTTGNPPLHNSNATPPPTPYALFVLETGDGYFITDMNSPHYYQTSGMHPLVLSLSGRYEIIRNPKAGAAKIYIPASNLFTPQSNLETANGERIRITPAATDILPDEEMLYIITYKLPLGASNAKVYFFYNQPEVSGMVPVSDETLIPGNTILFPTTPPYDVQRVRTYFGEQLDHTIPPANVSVPGILSSQYEDLLDFTLGSPPSLERNIFVTLKSKEKLTQQDTLQFRAALVYTDSTREVKYHIATLAMTTTTTPHDPNYITGTPRCLVKATGTKRVNYKLHFQNNGDGAAYKLNINVDLDPRLTEAAEKLTKDSFRLIIGKKNISDFTYTREGSRLTFGIELRSGSNIDSSLSSNKVEHASINMLTMGDIYFGLDVPVEEEADFFAVASIIFHAEDTRAMGAVNTDTSFVFVRTKCNESLLPVTERLPAVNNGGGNNGNDNGGDQGGTGRCVTLLWICWWWWVIIFTAVFVGLVFLLARRRNKSRKEPTGK